jgi:hypothetical protein
MELCKICWSVIDGCLGVVTDHKTDTIHMATQPIDSLAIRLTRGEGKSFHPREPSPWQIQERYKEARDQS